MNGFADWKSGGSLQQIFESTRNQGNSINNHGSLEDLYKSILGGDIAPQITPPTPISEELELSKKKAQEFADAAKRIEELAAAVEERIQKESEPEVKPLEEEEAAEEVVPQSKAYRVFRDRDENFECKITIQGAGLAAAEARIILDSDLWNFTFYGKLYKDGRCVVPLKRGIPLPEGHRGRARLEVIVDEQLFIPWEDDFVVEGSKKVQAEIKSQPIVKVTLGNLPESD
jgi:hypothetical protein